MEILTKLEQLPKDIEYLIITLGNFDGVHLGHRKLISELVSEAKKHNGKSLIFTFDPHPIAVLAPEKEPPLVLTSNDEQIEILQGAAIDFLLYYPFSKELALISAWDFAHDYLKEGLRAKQIIIGPNFQFGHKRQGNPGLLKQWEDELGFEVKVVEPVILEDEVISSSRIRRALLAGKMAEASRLLGYEYFLIGKVICGASRGRKLGFPTINMSLPDKLIPPNGVYVTKAKINDNWYLGVSNLGVRPTFSESVLTLETHFLDYHETSLPEVITLQFNKRLRDELTFDSVEALIVQISKDIEAARNFTT